MFGRNIKKPPLGKKIEKETNENEGGEEFDYLDCPFALSVGELDSDVLEWSHGDEGGRGRNICQEDESKTQEQSVGVQAHSIEQGAAHPANIAVNTTSDLLDGVDVEDLRVVDGLIGKLIEGWLAGCGESS